MMRGKKTFKNRTKNIQNCQKIPAAIFQRDRSRSRSISRVVLCASKGLLGLELHSDALCLTEISTERISVDLDSSR